MWTALASRAHVANVVLTFLDSGTKNTLRFLMYGGRPSCSQIRLFPHVHRGSNKCLHYLQNHTCKAAQFEPNTTPVFRAVQRSLGHTPRSFTDSLHHTGVFTISFVNLCMCSLLGQNDSVSTEYDILRQIIWEKENEWQTGKNSEGAGHGLYEVPTITRYDTRKSQPGHKPR